MYQKVRSILEMLAAERKTISFYHLLKEASMTNATILEKELIEILFSIGWDCINDDKPCLVYLVSRKGTAIYAKFFNEFHLENYKDQLARFPKLMVQERFYQKVKSEIFDFWCPDTNKVAQA